MRKSEADRKSLLVIRLSGRVRGLNSTTTEVTELVELALLRRVPRRQIARCRFGWRSLSALCK
jgi:hypothetical protein